jgi:hypothetical protein
VVTGEGRFVVIRCMICQRNSLIEFDPPDAPELAARIVELEDDTGE